MKVDGRYVSQGGPWLVYVKKLLGGWSIIQKHSPVKHPPQPTESRLSLCLAPHKAKTNGWRPKHKFGNWMIQILFNQSYDFAYGLLQGIIQWKKSILRWMEFCDWMDQRCCVKWEGSVHQEGTWSLPEDQRADMLDVPSFTTQPVNPSKKKKKEKNLKKRTPNCYGTIYSSTNLDGFPVYFCLSFCPSINPIFTRPIPCVRCYPKCKQVEIYCFVVSFCYLCK